MTTQLRLLSKVEADRSKLPSEWMTEFGRYVLLGRLVNSLSFAPEKHPVSILGLIVSAVSIPLARL